MMLFWASSISFACGMLLRKTSVHKGHRQQRSWVATRILVNQVGFPQGALFWTPIHILRSSVQNLFLSNFILFAAIVSPFLTKPLNWNALGRQYAYEIFDLENIKITMYRCWEQSKRVSFTICQHQTPAHTIEFYELFIPHPLLLLICRRIERQGFHRGFSIWSLS